MIHSLMAFTFFKSKEEVSNFNALTCFAMINLLIEI